MNSGDRISCDNGAPFARIGSNSFAFALLILPRAVRLGAVGRVFELFHGFLDLGVPQLVVAFVAAVDGLGHGRESDGAHVHELANRVVEGEAVHAVHEGDHHLRRRRSSGRKKERKGQWRHRKKRKVTRSYMKQIEMHGTNGHKKILKKSLKGWRRTF